MRAVNLNPTDGASAIEEMKASGAEIVGNVNDKREAVESNALLTAFCFLLTDYLHLCLQSSLASFALRSQIFRSFLNGINLQTSFFTL